MRQVDFLYHIRRYNTMKSKVYCERCDTVLDSREEYDRHMELTHSGVSCETCAVDAFISKVARFFKK